MSCFSQPVSKKKKEKERCSLLMEKLKEEFKQQEEHNQRVMASLKHERDSWLPASKFKIILRTSRYIPVEN